MEESLFEYTDAYTNGHTEESQWSGYLISLLMSHCLAEGFEGTSPCLPMQSRQGSLTYVSRISRRGVYPDKGRAPQCD